MSDRPTCSSVFTASWRVIHCRVAREDSMRESPTERGRRAAVRFGAIRPCRPTVLVLVRQTGLASPPGVPRLHHDRRFANARQASVRDSRSSHTVERVAPRLLDRQLLRHDRRPREASPSRGFATRSAAAQTHSRRSHAPHAGSSPSSGDGRTDADPASRPILRSRLRVALVVIATCSPVARYWSCLSVRPLDRLTLSGVRPFGPVAPGRSCLRAARYAQSRPS